MTDYTEVFKAQVSRLPESQQPIQIGYLQSAFSAGKWTAIPKAIDEPPQANVDAWQARNAEYVKPFPGPMQAKLFQILNTVSRNCFWEGYNVGRTTDG